MGSSPQHVVALKDFGKGPCGPVNDRLLRSHRVVYQLRTFIAHPRRILEKEISLYGITCVPFNLRI